jgi:hypothetical protein
MTIYNGVFALLIVSVKSGFTSIINGRQNPLRDINKTCRVAVISVEGYFCGLCYDTVSRSAVHAAGNSKLIKQIVNLKGFGKETQLC